MAIAFKIRSVRLDDEPAAKPPKRLIGALEDIEFSALHIDFHGHRLNFVRKRGIETAGLGIVNGADELGYDHALALGILTI